AKTQDRLNKAESSFSGVESAIAGFERMEEKAMRMLDESEAMASLNKEPEDPMDSLETKYGSGSTASVDDELAKLKAEMGL
ncbi:MAG: PspA/IM30 family protein, partial [Oscillospiraceae bacterium]|nr:PspA/IM30 family protein [Oscillospiraceae bacterium]